MYNSQRDREWERWKRVEVKDTAKMGVRKSVPETKIDITRRPRQADKRNCAAKIKY